MPIAVVNVTNETEGQADVVIAHQYGSSVVDDAAVSLSAGGSKLGLFTINFGTGPGARVDRWFFRVSVKDGPALGEYQSRRGTRRRPGSPCKVKADDVVINLRIRTDQCVIERSASGNVAVRMRRTALHNPRITNVFVLMLENRSFDHIFGHCDPNGFDLKGAPARAETLPDGKSNSFLDRPYACLGEPLRDVVLTNDPGHDFLDIMEQLCGTHFVQQQTFDKEAWFAQNPLQSGQPQSYPEIDMSGFAANSARQCAEVWRSPLEPAEYWPHDDLQQVMTGVAGNVNLAIRQLAREFALCDRWHASMPGPTWPNRFFAVAGCSAGLDDSPESVAVGESMMIPGLTYVFKNGTLFDRLTRDGWSWRIYMDKANQFVPADAPTHFLGKWAIARGMSGISIRDIREFGRLADDLSDDYDAQFTWIEPNYGDIRGHSYASGSSQHPIDSLDAGERLIAATYAAIRNSPLWETSLLIITYDEHGGLYDHVRPPSGSTFMSNDDVRYSKRRFAFDRLGVRVPTVVVSPLIPKYNTENPQQFNVIDSNDCDHTSIISTVSEIFELVNLTSRVGAMPSATSLLELSEARGNCPKKLDLSHLTPDAAHDQRRALSAANQDARDAMPLPDRGNIQGSLRAAIDTDVELSDGSPVALEGIAARVRAINTVGEANRYAAEVWAKVQADEQATAAFDGSLSGADAANLADSLGVSVDGLRDLRAELSAGRLAEQLISSFPANAERELVADWIDDLEADRLQVYDDDGTAFVVPPGTSERLRRLLGLAAR